MQDIVSKFVDLKGFTLKQTREVEHNKSNVFWLRFERDDGLNTGLQGEHISALIDAMTYKIIGLTRMQGRLTGETFVTHQEALQNAIRFLTKAAPDLMTDLVNCPTIENQPLGSRLEFNPRLALGLVEIHGMKVKMFIPSTQLWVWVIIDKEGKVETFERDIHWNFEISTRETQKWLHDEWLNHNDEFDMANKY